MKRHVPRRLPSLRDLLCVCWILACWAFCGSGAVHAEEAEQWKAPFGGSFSAYFTIASDYSFAGISQTKNGFAFQPSLDYKTAEVSDSVPLWLYLTAWGSNIDFPTTGPGIEIDLSGGVKFLAFKRKLSFDFGYIRYLYPGVPVDLAYDYGEFNLNVGYDFGVATLAARIRYSPHSFGDSGNSWNRRALLSVPLPFLAFSENVSFKAYGSLGKLRGRSFPRLRHPEWRLLVLAGRPDHEDLRTRLQRRLHRHQHRAGRLRQHQLLLRPRIRRCHQGLLE